jgi:transposase
MADLSDAQWDYVRLLVEWQQRSRRDGRGGRGGDARQALNGVLWILRTGAPWKDLPARYGSYQTCHRRFQQWQRTEVSGTGHLFSAVDTSLLRSSKNVLITRFFLSSEMVGKLLIASLESETRNDDIDAKRKICTQAVA